MASMRKLKSVKVDGRQGYVLQSGRTAPTGWVASDATFNGKTVYIRS